jgi:anti-sigma regulatory factor (Ser/Thr protein kinase)
MGLTYGDSAASTTESFTFPPDASSAASARRAVGTVLEVAGYQGDHHVVALLVSEVTTNAVIHAATAFEVVVEARSDAVSVDVIDGDAHHSTGERPIDLGATGGRGLRLVEALADRWGCDEVDADHKSVWFSIGPPA